jgi:LAO/AO transport system kinase
LRKILSTNDYIQGITAGNIAVLSKAITLVESTNPQHQEQAIALIDAILPYTGKAIRIGITGVPGVGKSTFIESFGMHAIALGKKVAVLAIDPSSTISRGSILGDKTRMETLSVHPQAYIRPSASAGSLGGLTYKTKEAALLCEAAGFEIIIIETVGVGQSEIAVSYITDFFLLLMLAGAGDELQGIKRGIMEMADALVITKADAANVDKAKAARAEYARALHFLPPQESGWVPQALISSAYENKGIDKVLQLIMQYQQHQISNGYWHKKRQDQNLYAFNRLLEEQMRILYLNTPDVQTAIVAVQQQIQQGTITPYSAVLQIKTLLSNRHV